jgi:membrane protein
VEGPDDPTGPKESGRAPGPVGPAIAPVGGGGASEGSAMAAHQARAGAARSAAPRAGHSARLDAFQRRHPAVGLPLAVIYKFFDDQGTYLAAQMTYYGFLSLFPLLLLLVSGLGAALHGDVQLQHAVLHSALSQFPVIGGQIGQDIHSFHGSAVAVAVGVLGSLYGGLGIAQAAQNALSKIWAIPRHSRPDPLRSRLRSLLLLLVLGTGTLATTGLTAVTTQVRSLGSVGGSGGLVFGFGERLAGFALSLALDVALLLLAYRILTDRRVALRHLLLPSVVGAAAWQLLQWLGTYYVVHKLQGSTATYGLFGIVLGLIAWIYLGCLIFLLVAELAAVRVRRLWPRSLLTPFTDRVQLTVADREAYASYATTESFKSFERIDVSFHGQHTAPRAERPSPERPSPDRPSPERPSRQKK